MWICQCFIRTKDWYRSSYRKRMALFRIPLVLLTEVVMVSKNHDAWKSRIHGMLQDVEAKIVYKNERKKTDWWKKWATWTDGGDKTGMVKWWKKEMAWRKCNGNIRFPPCTVILFWTCPSTHISTRNTQAHTKHSLAHIILCTILHSPRCGVHWVWVVGTWKIAWFLATSILSETAGSVVAAPFDFLYCLKLPAPEFGNESSLNLLYVHVVHLECRLTLREKEYSFRKNVITIINKGKGGDSGLLKC